MHTRTHAQLELVSQFQFILIVTPHACVRGKVISFVCHLLAQKSPNLDVSASEQVVSATKHLKPVKKLACIWFI